MQSAEGTCPVCGKRVKITFLERDLPHIGKVVISTLFCPSCGYKHTDVYEVESKGPAVQKLLVDSPRKLNALVIRSSTCKVSIPELGLELCPGPFSQGFISTVEGILQRFLEVATTFGERAAGTVSAINDAINGRRSFTIVLEDPRGVSRIILRGVGPSQQHDVETP